MILAKAIVTEWLDLSILLNREGPLNPGQQHLNSIVVKISPIIRVMMVIKLSPNNLEIVLALIKRI